MLDFWENDEKGLKCFFLSTNLSGLYKKFL